MQKDTRLLPPENAKPLTMNEMSSGPMGVAKFLIGAFSKVTTQCDPPSENKTTHIRLITISVSHYCEKVRWVLDHIEAKDDNPYYYTEDGHPPGFHAFASLQASNEVASITPMILYKEGDGKKVLMHDSAQIVQHFMPELYPKAIKEDVQKMEANLGERLGPALRCIAYFHLFGEDLDKIHTVATNFCADPRKVATIEHKLFDKFLDKGLGDAIKKSLKITKEANEASEKEMREVFEEISSKLDANGGQYIMNDPSNDYGFTAADLTFAALSYPFMTPPEMQFWNLDDKKMPDAIVNLQNELRATTAGQHVLKIYKEHRLPPNKQREDGSKGIVEMKCSERNKKPWEGWFW